MVLTPVLVRQIVARKAHKFTNTIEDMKELRSVFVEIGVDVTDVNAAIDAIEKVIKKADREVLAVPS